MSLGLKRGTVKLVPHNPQWETLFKEEKKLLMDIFGDTIIARVGSKLQRRPIHLHRREGCVDRGHFTASKAVEGKRFRILKFCCFWLPSLNRL